MGNASEVPDGVRSESATETELEGWFVGVSAFMLPDDATPELRARVTSIRLRLLIKQVAHFIMCYYCDRPSVAVLIETISSAFAFCASHVPCQFKTGGIVDYSKSSAVWCGQGGHFGLITIEKYLRCLCGPFRTDADGRYFKGSNFFDVGEGVHVVLTGDGAVTSQGVNTSPIVLSRAPAGLAKDDLDAWCVEEIERLIQAIVAETRQEIANI